MENSNNVSCADNQQERLTQSLVCIHDQLRIASSDGWYIAGFVDGEGSFNVSIKKRSDYEHQWKITASFNISQKDRKVLEWIQSVLHCGSIRERNDGVLYYEVTTVASLQKVIIPLFTAFPFHSEKKENNFLIFKEIVHLMSIKNHLNPKGLHEILILRESLNEGKGRKRKYTIEDVKESSETIRRVSLKQCQNADVLR